MKVIGATATSLTMLGLGAGSVSAAEYETITVAEGEQELISVGDGETLENVLIDISAPGADARIEASGDDWTVRNVGFRGTCDVDKFDGFWNRLHVSGNGIVERVYLGDGCVSDINCGGAGTPSSHSGNVTVRQSYFAEWTDNALYSAHSAENGGGTVHVQDCYFRDNNVAHLRIAADGDVAERCVIENTGNVPDLGGGDIHSKGVYTGYGDPSQVVEIRDCNIDVSNTNGDADAFNSNDEWHSEMSTIAVSDTAYDGSIMGPYVELRSGNGDAPVLEIPDGVPTSPEAAASGNGGTTPTSGSGDDTDSTPDTEYETIVIGEGEQRQIEVGSGETLENVLIDMRADGADPQIVTSGSGWTVRNVGFLGRCDVHKGDGNWNRFNVSGHGTVDRVYLGDGCIEGINAGGMGSPSGHSGHVDISRIHVAEWSDNGIYTAHTAESGHGTVHIVDSYFRDNNVGHLRIAADGDVVERTVIENTGNVRGDGGSGDVHSKGVYTGYGEPGQVVEIVDCDIDVEKGGQPGDAFNSNDEWHPEMSTIAVSDTEFLGSVQGPFVELGSGNGDSPNLEIPTGVPMSAEDAASGGSGGNTEPSDPNSSPSVSIVAPSNGDTMSGTASVTVDATDAEDDDSALSVGVSIDGGGYQSAGYDDSTGYFTYDVDTTSVGDGAHTIDARATDGDGATTEADQVEVTIDNTSDATGPTVERFEVAEEGSLNPHADITVDWGVADADGDLGSVLVQVADSNGAVVDAARSSVSGDSAYDLNYFRIRGASGETFDVTLTVADSDGNTESVTGTVTE